MKIADICPVFFNPIMNKYKQDVDYMQCFHNTDSIIIQYFGEETYIVLKNLTSGTNSNVSYQTFNVNDGLTLKYVSLTELPDGIYSIVIDGVESVPFEVSSSDEVLASSKLIKFSHKDNSGYFDNIFWLGPTQQIFNLRVEAFVDYDSSKIDMEQFRNQFQELTNLYAVPYDTYKLYIGNEFGVPYWFAKLINKIFCLSKIEIDGVLYVRSEKSDVAMSPISDNSQLYNMTIVIERVQNEVNGVGGREESGTVSLAGIISSNPKDGEVLQYKENLGAFTNSNTV